MGERLSGYDVEAMFGNGVAVHAGEVPSEPMEGAAASVTDQPLVTPLVSTGGGELDHQLKASYGAPPQLYDPDYRIE